MPTPLWNVLSITTTILFIVTSGYGLVPIDIQIDSESPINVVDERFLSVAVNIGIVRRGLDRYDLKSRRLLTLAKALNPAFLRLGGTGEDFMTFVPDSETNDKARSLEEKYRLDTEYMEKKPFNMTGKQLEQILKFKVNTQLELFIGLNVLQRKDGKWDDSNTKVLMNFVSERNVRVHWQLGNEPPWRKFNKSVDPEQLAADFKKMFELKSKYPLFWSSLLVGPDIGQMKDKKYKMSFYDDYISHAVPVLNAVTWHQYYGDGRTAKINDFMNPKLFNDLIHEIHVMTHLTRNYSPTIPMWLGETGTFYDGGTKGLSDSYVAGFMWLDKLGISARYGQKVVIRESLFGGQHYSLMDDDFTPRPDYWLSLIFKKLVGSQVLDVEVLTKNEKVRVYAHCINWSKTTYPKASIVIFAMNLDKNKKIRLSLKGRNLIRIDEFVLTPKNGDLTSKSVLLNGRVLEMPTDHSFPNIIPFKTDKIVLGPATFGFFVLSDFGAKACVR